MNEANEYRAVACCLFLLLLIHPLDLIANDTESFDRTPGRFEEMIADLKATIQAVNRIDALKDAYRRGEGYQVSEDMVRKRDLKGFDLQLEILRVRLNIPN